MPISRALLVTLFGTLWSPAFLAAEPTRQQVRAAVSTLASLRDSGDRGKVAPLEAMVHATDGHALRTELERELAQLLLSDAAMASKQEACHLLERIGTEQTLPVLSQLLVEQRTTSMIAAVLGGHSEPAAGKVLRDGLGRVDGDRRVPLVKALGERRDRRATTQLVTLAKDSSPALAVAATRALGAVATGPAIEFLETRLRAPAQELGGATSEALLVAARVALEEGRRSEAARAFAAIASSKSAALGARRSARAGQRELASDAELSADFSKAAAISLFDGRTLSGWEGNLDYFRVENGAIVAGSLESRIPNNEFLCTEKVFGDFELRLKVKLVGKGDNAGIQFRSLRVPNHHEVSGYQADMGTGWWGLLYDESRRNRPLCSPNATAVANAVNADGWNDYVIRCVGSRVQLELNGIRTVDYVEPNPSIRRRGIIGLQIHSGAPSEASYKDIVIRELPGK